MLERGGGGARGGGGGAKVNERCIWIDIYMYKDR